MTPLLPVGVRIFVASGYSDLRKSFDGLADLAREKVRQDPLSGNLFVFTNRRRNRTKVLFWDRTGWALWYKRLEGGLFRFPESEGGVVEVDGTQLRMLLDGIPLGVRLPARRRA